MPRLPVPEDLLTLRVPIDLQLSPDGRWVAFALKEAGPRLDEYRSSIWLVPSDGSTPARRLTLGAKNDTSPRWSPDGRSLAFLSDRAAWLQAGGASDRAEPAELPREGKVQVWLLPIDGGEARQVSRLRRDVTELAWSPDGRRLCLVSAVAPAREEARPDPSQPPPSDIRLIDRLAYQLNGVGFVYDRPGQLWLLDVESGEASLLTRGRTAVRTPAWSPDGRSIAFAADRRQDADLYWRSDVHLVDVATRRVTRVTGGRGEQLFGAPAWSPDGRWLAVLGHRYPAAAGSRADV
ncbi:MAG TPA: hypothetical protein VFK38_10605, partial [Candidatus Limnocylindrales bacterium]|nr:hypothetical protein [Candidatus Limnocylindrales bacterium]